MSKVNRRFSYDESFYEMLTALRTRSVFALFHRIQEHHEEAASDVNLMRFDNVEVIPR
jgi:hypothetical protein